MSNKQFSEGHRCYWLRTHKDGSHFDVPCVFVRYASATTAYVYRVNDPTQKHRRVPVRLVNHEPLFGAM